MQQASKAFHAKDLMLGRTVLKTVQKEEYLKGVDDIHADPTLSDVRARHEVYMPCSEVDSIAFSMDRPDFSAERSIAITWPPDWRKVIEEKGAYHLVPHRTKWFTVRCSKCGALDHDGQRQITQKTGTYCSEIDEETNEPCGADWWTQTELMPLKNRLWDVFAEAHTQRQRMRLKQSLL